MAGYAEGDYRVPLSGGLSELYPVAKVRQ